jgi:glutathione S-transferase
MAEYKLTYFNARGRAEFIRWIFYAAGQKFQDERIERSQWPELKPKTQLGTVPILEIRQAGKVQTLSQSFSIGKKNENEIDLI